MKIVIILVFAAILLALVLLLAYIAKHRPRGRVSNAPDKKKDPVAWHFWSALTLWLARIDALKAGAQNSGPAWADYRQRHERITGLLRRVQAYIEAHPDDVLRISDMEHILPVAHDFFRKYGSGVSLGTDTHSGKEYLHFVQTGLDSVEKILNDFIDLVFQNKGSDLQAEIDVMLKWYGDNNTRLGNGPG
ncbi:MAG: hypothetical protein FWB88_05845 [Defluviitaleaceae bacterium]|nr:hypothetical protein [Defluviitaleaceae bacterium]MCL2239901.1 hypothetical protein [Defluviitaleaceae bacterium]